MEKQEPSNECPEPSNEHRYEMYNLPHDPNLTQIPIKGEKDKYPYYKDIPVWDIKTDEMPDYYKKKKDGTFRKYRIDMYSMRDDKGKLERSHLMTFATIQDAAEERGIDSGNILKCVKGERKTAGGYDWEVF